MHAHKVNTICMYAILRLAQSHLERQRHEQNNAIFTGTDVTRTKKIVSTHTHLLLPEKKQKKKKVGGINFSPSALIFYQPDFKETSNSLCNTGDEQKSRDNRNDAHLHKHIKATPDPEMAI